MLNGVHDLLIGLVRRRRVKWELVVFGDLSCDASPAKFYVDSLTIVLVCGTFTA